MSKDDNIQAKLMQIILDDATACGAIRPANSLETDYFVRKVADTALSCTEPGEFATIMEEVSQLHGWLPDLSEMAGIMTGKGLRVMESMAFSGIEKLNPTADILETGDPVLAKRCGKQAKQYLKRLSRRAV